MTSTESGRRLKVHYHSDCAFFAGCENMLANFFNSAEFRDDFALSFSYRFTALYEEGLAHRVHGPVQMYALAFPDLSELDTLPTVWPHLLKRIVMAVPIVTPVDRLKCPRMFHVKHRVTSRCRNRGRRRPEVHRDRPVP